MSAFPFRAGYVPGLCGSRRSRFRSRAGTLAAVVLSVVPLMCSAAEPAPSLGLGRFAGLRAPSRDVRLKVRARPDTASLAALAAAGFGSVELGVNFVAGASAARETLHSALQTAHRLGLGVDLSPGGAQPYQSPGISEAGSMQQLLATHADIAGGGEYAGAVEPPHWLVGEPTLVAVTAARVVGDSGTTVLLEARSAIDLTSAVNSARLLHWRVPPGRWELFTFWQRATGQVASRPPFEDPRVWAGRLPRTGPGRYLTADLFSGLGIGQGLKYLERNILPGNLSLLRGADLAHDSLEVQAQMFWTADLPRQFERRRGYSLIRFLPVLYTPRAASFNPIDPTWGGPLPPRPFDFAGDAGRRVRYDYRQTLTDLYCERYLRSIRQWAHARGLEDRIQVAYNYFALDMLRSGRAVDIPENESFDSGWSRPFDPTLPPYGSARWRHAIDSYRLTGSAAHLSGATRATIEFGDDFAIYRKQPVDYAQQLEEAFAGGITLGVLTGFSSADGGWPVPSGLAHIGLGDEWTAGWPQWRDWPALTSYFARATQLLESGHPRIDVTIYHDRGLSTVHDDAPLFASARLGAAGYTYDFIDPAALLAPEAAKVAGELYGRRVGYRALILDNVRSMPFAAARSILAMARRGLHVVIVGPMPQESTGYYDHAAGDRVVAHAMAALATLPTVAHVDTEDEVPAALVKLAILPSASFGDRSPLMSVLRRGPEEDLWWIFNPSGESVSARASFAASGAPYSIDLWSGQVSRIAQWTVARGRTLMPLWLAPHAATVVVIQRGERVPVHVLSSNAGPIFEEGRAAWVIAAPAGNGRLTLSDGETRTIDFSSLPRAIGLARWHLRVDAISPRGERHHDLGTVPLADWRSIPQLRHAVGRATYSAQVELSPAWFGPGRGILLSVGDVAGAMRLAVNGHVVTEQTTGFGRWLVGSWLKPGANRVTIRLDTTLLNEMAALRAAGDPRYQTGPTPLPTAPSGLLGPVRLSSVARVELSQSSVPGDP